MRFVDHQCKSEAETMAEPQHFVIASEQQDFGARFLNFFIWQPSEPDYVRAAEEFVEHLPFRRKKV
jgi:hypothetical protein